MKINSNLKIFSLFMYLTILSNLLFLFKNIAINFNNLIIRFIFKKVELLNKN